MSGLASENQGNLPLWGKLAIVTGGSRGIGAAIVYELAKRGAKVVITYTSPKSEAEVNSLISKVQALSNGSQASSICADLRKPGSPDIIAAHAAEFADGRIDILVNNAGVELVKSLGSITADDFDYVYNLNVRAPLLMTQAVLPYLQSHARIINISSVGSRSGFPGLSVYCSSKAALEGLTRCFAAELGSNGTTVNTVSPGPVETAMIENIPKDIVQMQKRQTPLENRIANVEDISLVVAWLAGEDSRWITGQVISASGGYAM